MHSLGRSIRLESTGQRVSDSRASAHAERHAERRAVGLDCGPCDERCRGTATAYTGFAVDGVALWLNPAGLPLLEPKLLQGSLSLFQRRGSRRSRAGPTAPAFFWPTRPIETSRGMSRSAPRFKSPSSCSLDLVSSPTTAARPTPRAPEALFVPLRSAVTAHHEAIQGATHSGIQTIR